MFAVYVCMFVVVAAARRGTRSVARCSRAPFCNTVLDYNGN